VARHRHGAWRRSAGGAEARQELQPVLVGQGEVEQDQVRRVSRTALDARGHRRRDRDAVPGLLEQEAERVGDERAVFDEQDVGKGVGAQLAAT
jgi:hypothetical protein